MANQGSDPSNDKQPNFNAAQKQAIRQQVEEMVKQGYQLAHLVVNQDGKVVYDPEAVERDAFIQAVKEDETQQEIKRLTELGYQRDHLTITSNGKVVYDPEAAERDAFIQAVENDQQKK